MTKEEFDFSCRATGLAHAIDLNKSRISTVGERVKADQIVADAETFRAFLAAGADG